MSPRRTHASDNRRPPVVRSGGPRPRKELGQHFLVDAGALQRIVTAAELNPGDAVLEIGPGTGELTAALLDGGARVAAVELDERLSIRLRARFAGVQSLHVISANVLDHDPLELLAEARLAPPYVVVANIPYYITAPILRHFLENPVQPRQLVLMVQREVAESLAAKPGSMSLLAVSVQFFATAEVLFRLGPASFYPPPKVDSAVVRIQVADTPRVNVAFREEFFDVVRAGFRQPRKQLHNALSQGLWLPPGEAEPLLREAGIDPLRRAQTLSLDEWKSVYESYSRRKQAWAVNTPGRREASS